MQTQKLLTFFSKNISIYAIFNVQSFNNMLTNDIISFEQLGPDVGFCGVWSWSKLFAQDESLLMSTHKNISVDK